MAKIIAEIIAKYYARVSSNNQRLESCLAQIDLITKYCQKRNIKLIGGYQDDFKSGKNDRRPGFQKLMKESENGDFNAIVCIQLDRFSRDISDSFKYIKKLNKNGVQLITVNESNEDNPENNFLRHIQIGIAQFNNEKLGVATLMGLRYNANFGLSVGGLPCLGFDLNSSKKLEINIVESKIVIWIFKRYAEGASYKTILKELDSKQYRTKKNNKFSKNSIYEILRNEKYNGVYTYNKRSKAVNGHRNNSKYKDDDEIIRVKDGCPKIIDDITFAKVQERLRNNKKRSGSYRAKHNYLLSGKIFCKCGFGMSGNPHSREGRDIYLSYICNAKKNKCSCDCPSISGRMIEEFVITQLVNYIYRKKEASKWAIGLNKYIAKQQPKNTDKIKENDLCIKSLDKRINSLLCALEDGTVEHEDVKVRLSELKFNKQELIDENERLTKQDEESTEITEAEVKEAFSRLKAYLINNPLEAKKLIEQYVKKVIIHKTDIEVIMKSTINLSDKYDSKLNKVVNEVA